MTDVTTIAGARELLGRGVYRGLPNDIPVPFRDRNAVVVGGAVECAAAAGQLGGAGWNVTVVTRETRKRPLVRECRRRIGTEVVCAGGRDYLEAVVLRRIDSGQIDASNASALFLL